MSMRGLFVSCVAVLGLACGSEPVAGTDAGPNRPDAMAAADAMTPADATMAEPDATMVEPDATMAEPDATMAEPDATMAEPDATMAEPDATMAEPDATMVEPDATAADAGPGGPDSGILPPTRDVVRPTVRIATAPGQSDPTRIQPLRFELAFSEPIEPSSLTADDLRISPSIPGLTATIVDAGDHVHFTAEIRLPELVTRITVALPDAAARDLAGNPSEPSPGFDAHLNYSPPGAAVRIEPMLSPRYPTVRSLPFSYLLSFSRAMDAATFDVSDVENAGTAQGVVWSLQAMAPGGSYSLSVTAVSTPGTLIPRVPAGRVSDVQHQVTNLDSAYVGRIFTYTPLPVLRVDPTTAREGDPFTFVVMLDGTAPAGLHFDWATRDGTAIAGVDYVAASAAGVSLSGFNPVARVTVNQTADDLLPEPHKSFDLVLRNAGPDVFLETDHASGTIINDDRGTWSLGGNNGFYAASAQRIALFGSTLWVYGTSVRQEPSLARGDWTMATPVPSLGFGQPKIAAGMGTNASAVFLGMDDSAGGFEIQKLSAADGQLDVGFGNFGVVTLSDQAPISSQTLIDVAADDTAVYSLAAETSGSTTAWAIEARDALTGALRPGFGAAGHLRIDHGAVEPEQPARFVLEGGALYVLGQVGSAWLLEKRSAVDGALVPGFGAGGVLALGMVSSSASLCAYQGKVYLAAAVSGGQGAVLQLDAQSGAIDWAYASPLTTAGGIQAGPDGIFVAGGRDLAWQVERYQLDGTPRWSWTGRRDTPPSLARAVLPVAMGDWVFFAGSYTYQSQQQEWVIERRWMADGMMYTFDPGDPIQ